MARQWITKTDVDSNHLGKSLASLSGKDWKIAVYIGDSQQSTPHVWRSRKEARRWVEGLAVVPVWRKGVWFDFLYDGVKLQKTDNAVIYDEVAFEGDPLDPPNEFLDAATTFEVPTEASLADLHSESHVDVADALIEARATTDMPPLITKQIPTDELAHDDDNFEELAARTRANAQSQHEDRHQKWSDIAHGLVERRAKLDTDWDAAVEAGREWNRDPPHSPSLTELGTRGGIALSCDESVYMFDGYYLCDKPEGHGGAHQDTEQDFRWGEPQFFVTDGPGRVVNTEEVKFEVPERLIIDLLSLPAQCESLCVIDGSRCIYPAVHATEIKEYSAWHESDTGKSWRVGLADITSEEHTDTLNEFLDALEELGVPENIGITVAYRDSNYTWRGYYWSVHPIHEHALY